MAKGRGAPYAGAADQAGDDGMWICEDCGWTWPLPGSPPDGAECDNCGGELRAVAPRAAQDLSDD